MRIPQGCRWLAAKRKAVAAKIGAYLICIGGAHDIHYHSCLLTGNRSIGAKPVIPYTVDISLYRCPVHTSFIPGTFFIVPYLYQKVLSLKAPNPLIYKALWRVLVLEESPQHKLTRRRRIERMRLLRVLLQSV